MLVFSLYWEGSAGTEPIILIPILTAVLLAESGSRPLLMLLLEAVAELLLELHL
jgi:hypothetical protein